MSTAVYTISFAGFGANKISTTYSPIRTVQGTRRYCFKYLREQLIRSTKSAEEESACFQKIEFEIHIGRIGKCDKLDSLIIPAIEILKYRGCKND